MINSLKQIKILRKKYGLTQIDLAKLAGVSQSLIAKVEAGLLDPTYSNAQKIFDALESLRDKKEVKASNILNTSLIFCNPNAEIREVIKKMKKHGISQMPVIDDKQPVGYISESIILDAMINHQSASKVSEVMKDSPPVVAKDCSVQIISNLLMYYPLVIVSEKGKYLGIITKADLLQVYH